MSSSPPDSPTPDDDDSRPAGTGARFLLTMTPFVVLVLVWFVLSWLGG